MSETKAKNNSFHDYVMPVIILVCVGVVTTALLAVTNSITAPIIEENTIQQANETRMELLTEADGFSEVETDLMSSSSSSVTEVYAADNGVGYVFTLETKSFGGTLTMMVGIDADGAITGVSVTDHADTPGVGTKNFTDDYLGQYAGLTSLTSDNVKKETASLASGGTFAYVSGASVTGTAVHDAVYLALEQYAAIGGGQ